MLVNEAAAIATSDKSRSDVIYRYRVLRAGLVPTSDLVEELIQQMGHDVGPTARPSWLEIVENLPRALGHDPAKRKRWGSRGKTRQAGIIDPKPEQSVRAWR